MLVHKRTLKDIWQNLYEYFIIETESDPHWNDELINDFMSEQLAANDYKILSVEPAGRQQLTHQSIHGYFIKIRLASVPSILLHDEYDWLNKKQIDGLAFPGFINQHFQNKKPY